MAQSLSLSLAAPEVAAQILSQAIPHDPSGMTSPEEAAASGRCFILEGQGGRAAYALGIVHHAAGSEAWVTALAGRIPGVDLVSTVLPLVIAQGRAAGCRTLAVTTRRPGLVRRLERAGFVRSALTLRMPL